MCNTRAALKDRAFALGDTSEKKSKDVKGGSSGKPFERRVYTKILEKSL